MSELISFSKQPSPNEPSVDSARLVRKLRSDWARRWAWRSAWFVGLPTLLAGGYYGFWASDEFDSVAVIGLRGAELGNAGHAESLLGSPSNAGASRELLAVREYILSRTLFEAVDDKKGLVRHYQDRRWDAVSRLSARSSHEQAFEYYTHKVTADVDSASGTLSLRVRAFDAKVAHDVAAVIVSMTESMLEKTTAHVRDEVIRDADRQVAEAKQKLLLARRGSRPNVGTLAGAGAETDPPKASASRGGNVEGALNAGNGDDAAQLELNFAEKSYESSVALLAEARRGQLSQKRFLVTLATPSAPDQPTYPRRLASVLTVFLFSFLTMGVATLTVAAIREHVRV